MSNNFSDTVFSLGELYVSDFVNDNDDARGGKHDLSIVIDERYGAARLKNPVSVHNMFGKYWYRSGINASMRSELQSIVTSICSTIKLETSDLWLDIACNDGTLLSFVPSNIKKLGIDPADNSFYNESSQHADQVIQDFFTKENYQKSKFKDIKAKIITCIAMFYDLDEPELFLNDVYDILDDDGLLVLQMSYTPLMIHQLAFDNICHEHVYYWSLISIEKLLNKCGFTIRDCQLNDTNGGSYRLYIQKIISKESFFGTVPYRDVCNFRIDSLKCFETTQKLDDPLTWLNFYKRINQLKEKTLSFIKQEKNNGKTIFGYGASTKGNTLLQYFKLDSSLVTCIAERSPYKYGLKTVGTNIPIISEEEMRKTHPDYLLILPWHFISEFLVRESDYLNKGGKFIIPCPEFKVVGKNET
jgi:SAM-dependent methyltransferase